MLTVSPLGTEPLWGHKVVLERSNPTHASFLLQCYQDSAFMDLYRLAQKRSETLAQIKKRLEEEQAFQLRQLKRIEWVIHQYKVENEQLQKSPIGLISLADYKPTYLQAEFLIGILNTDKRCTGLALEASLLVLDFAFNQLRLHRLTAYVYGYNHNAQANVVELGFKQEGVLRDHVRTQKQFVDLYANGMLEQDFRENQRLARLSKRLLGENITLPPPEIKSFSPVYLAQVETTLRQKVAHEKQNQH